MGSQKKPKGDSAEMLVGVGQPQDGLGTTHAEQRSLSLYNAPHKVLLSVAQVYRHQMSLRRLT